MALDSSCLSHLMPADHTVVGARPTSAWRRDDPAVGRGLRGWRSGDAQASFVLAALWNVAGGEPKAGLDADTKSLHI